jgi:hypothetical protein
LLQKKEKCGYMRGFTKERDKGTGQGNTRGKEEVCKEEVMGDHYRMREGGPE